MTQVSIYLDPARSAEERADDLIAQMTPAEKVAQLGSYWVFELLERAPDGSAGFSEAQAHKLLSHGVGQITRVGGASNVTPQESAVLNNRIQKYLLEATRLKIPAVIHEECCSGYMARGTTVFPQTIGVASTWQPELVEAMTDVIREQMRSVGAHHALAPVLDVARDARWGRVEETFGEDPYLVAAMGVAYVRGLQSASLERGIVATGKHFVGYGMSEGGMNWAPPHIMPRELREVYLYPFEAAVYEAGLASMMNGYHELDGIPCGANRWLLTDVLRGEWGFTGTVVSDYFAVNQLFTYHRIARDLEDAARLALEAGLDVELPGTDAYGESLLQAVEAGRIPMELVDLALKRVLTQKFTLGIFEQPYVDEGAVAFDTPDQRALARQIAQQSMVLLKNDGILPLNKSVESIALIGPNADSVRNLFGDYAYPAHMETLIEMQSSGNVFRIPIPVVNFSASDWVTAKTVREALTDAAQATIYYAQGCDVLSDSKAGFAEAVEAARKASIAVMVMGDKAGLTDSCTSGEARDRADLDLPGVQPDLVRAVAETGTPIVLVLVNGRPVTFGDLLDKVSAIVEAWLPSEEGADAIVDVLFGNANPGGKLPITFPRTVGQLPTYYGHKPSGGRSHWKGAYVETSNLPQFPFGFGLSYTTFSIDDLTISGAASANETVQISVRVTNTGSVAGDEVVQLYTRQFVRGITRPSKELRGFKRVSLEPGQSKRVSFHLAVNQLAFYNAHDDFVVEPGMVDVMVGSSSEDLPCTGTFTITGATASVQNKTFFSAVVVE